MRPFVILVALTGCPSTPPTDTDGTGLCPAEDPAWAELSQGDGWGLDDGALVSFGIPPQGGAPFAPFLVRLHGAPPSPDGYLVEMEAFDHTLEQSVGEGSYNQRFVCANVGENEGTRIASEFHMRFFGWESADLADHPVTITIDVTPVEGSTVTASFDGTLAWVLGPMPDPE